jgi:cell division GTPase FtsZ
MRVLWIGFGQAGGKITDTLMGLNRKLYDVVAINTEQADLEGLNNIREKILIGRYALKGRGVGSNIELGSEIAEKALSQMMDRIDVMVRRFDPEAFWIAAGLAGGTGAGGSYVLANELNRVYRGTPVYGLGIVPSTAGMPTEKEALNLSNSLKSFELWSHYFNNILLVDNQQFELDMVTRESVEQMFQRSNAKLALMLTTLLNAGEVRPAPQEVFSSSEIKATLGMIGDVSTIGFCSEPIKLKSRFWRQGIDPGTHELESIIERSVAESSLTFPCDVSGARSASLVVHGRPDHLFTQAISRGRTRLEQLTTVSQVRYGDYPDRNSGHLSAITVVSGISDFSRLERMKRRVEELSWDSASVSQPSTDGVPEHLTV